MPCFMVGYTHAKLLADAWNVPLFEFSHQQGHIAAAAWSAERLELLEREHLAWHLSGGTTELLLVKPEANAVSCEKIGGTTDISAGQLIDRTGQLLDLPFPSGKHLDMLCQTVTDPDYFPVKCTDFSFSFSGVQNKVQQFFASTKDPAATAAFALRSVSEAVLRTTKNALAQYPGLPVILSGGVASNTLLRTILKPIDPVIAQPQYSTDNALGIAVLAYRAGE